MEIFKQLFQYFYMVLTALNLFHVFLFYASSESMVGYNVKLVLTNTYTTPFLGVTKLYLSKKTNRT